MPALGPPTVAQAIPGISEIQAVENDIPMANLTLSAAPNSSSAPPVAAADPVRMSALMDMLASMSSAAHSNFGNIRRHLGSLDDRIELVEARPAPIQPAIWGSPIAPRLPPAPAAAPALQPAPIQAPVSPAPAAVSGSQFNTAAPASDPSDLTMAEREALNFSVGARTSWEVANARYSILNMSAPMGMSPDILNLEQQRQNFIAMDILAPRAHAATQSEMESIELATIEARAAWVAVEERKAALPQFHP